MLAHWIKTGWRSLMANPLFSLITIASLSIGCCGAVLAGSNIKQHLSYERWMPEANHVAKVTLFVKGSLAGYAVRGRGGSLPGDGAFAAPLMAGPLQPLLASGRFPEIVASTRIFPAAVPIEGYSEEQQPKAISVDPSFFDVFDLPVLAGDPRAAVAARGQAVVTESFAKLLFGSASNALGKTIPLRTDELPLPQIGAVIRDLPVATHLDFDVVTGRAYYSRQNFSSNGLPGTRVASGPDPDSQWNLASRGAQYVRYAASFDAEAGRGSLEKTLTGIVQTADGATPSGPAVSLIDRVSLVPLLDLHLAGPENTGIESTGDLLSLLTLGGAAIALLGVSAFNYVILSLARSLRRKKEVAVRKVLGAGKGALVRHYLAEAAMVAALSLAIGFALAELLQPWFARALAQPESLVNLYDRWFLGIAGGVLVLLVLAVGFYPAFYLAGVRPRAGLENVSGDNLGPIGRTITSGLLALQVGAATVLLSISLVMAAQSRFVTERPLGFNIENMYRLSNVCLSIQQLPNGLTLINGGGVEQTQCRMRHLADLRALPGVEAVSSFTGQLANPEVIPTEDFGVPGSTAPLGKTARINVDTDFLQMMGATLLAGRFFNNDSSYDRRLIDNWSGTPDPSVTSVPVIITRAMLPLIGAATPEDAIGKPMQRKAQGALPLEVVGVVEDWHQRSLRYQTNPIIFVPGGDALTPIISVKPENIAAVTERLSALPSSSAPQAPNARPITALADVFKDAYAGDHRLMFAVLGFAGISILVACLGVYGLTAFDMRRRVREIGIRKALGATPGKVAGMVLGRQLLFATLASVASWPVGWWLSNEWLQQYAYRTPLGPIALPIASLAVVVFAALAVGLNTGRAAAIRPGLALRTAT